MTTNVVPMQSAALRRPRDYDPAQLALIRRTVAADTTADEFNMFIKICQGAGLDPFRRQIYCVVYNKDDEKKRKVAFITGIDGLRAVAQRNGDYRPDDDEPQFTIDEELKGPSNPRGLVKAVVKAFKRYGSEWHPVVGVAYWNEFAPMKNDVEGGFRWEDTGEKWPDTGKPKRRKVPINPDAEAVQVPSGKWADMPFVMLAKCAESQALRKGWPEDLSALYSPEEMERPMLDVTPSDAVEQHATEQRMLRIGATNTIPIQWKAGDPLEAVPVGQFADSVMKFLQVAESSIQVTAWQNLNQLGLREFWAKHASDALDLKKAIEARIVELDNVSA